MFVRRVKTVQDILFTFEYVKIAQLLDKYIICNWIFLILCLILCVFLIVYIFMDAFWFAFFSTTFIDNNYSDSSSSVDQICDKVFSTRNSSDLLLPVEQTYEIIIYFVTVISVLMG